MENPASRSLTIALILAMCTTPVFAQVDSESVCDDMHQLLQATTWRYADDASYHVRFSNGIRHSQSGGKVWKQYYELLPTSLSRDGKRIARLCKLVVTYTDGLCAGSVVSWYLQKSGPTVRQLVEYSSGDLTWIAGRNDISTEASCRAEPLVLVPRR